MVLVEDLKSVIYSKLQPPTATVRLYTGKCVAYRGSFIRPVNNGGKKLIFYQSTFDLMQQCADQLRLSKSSFQYCLFTDYSVSSHLLPYSRFIGISESRGEYALRLFHQHITLDDLLHNDPETFNYIFHQAKADFYLFLRNCEQLEKTLEWVLSSYGMLFAGLLKRLNMKCISVNFERLMRLLEVPNNLFVKQHSRNIIENAHNYAEKVATVDEIHAMFVRRINKMVCTSVYKYQVSVSVESKKLPAEITEEATLVISDTELCIGTAKVQVLTTDYHQIEKITICKSKQSVFEIVLKDSTVIAITILSDISGVIESCLAMIDMYFRAHVKARMLIEPVCNNDFDPYAMTFNELNQSQTSTNIYNIIEKSELPLNFLSVRQSHQILKDLGFKVGWYVLFKQSTPHVYPLCIVLNSEANGDKKIHHIRILNKDGYFVVDENSKRKKNLAEVRDQSAPKYRSLEDLMQSINIRVCNKKLIIRPTQIVTEEMVLDLRKNFIGCDEYDAHKQSHILSLFCLQLTPNSFCTKPLCTFYTGKWLNPEGKEKDIRAFLYDKKYIEKDSLNAIAKIAEISRPEFVHENILKCYGFADDCLNTIFYVHDLFGDEFSDTFEQGYSVGQLFEFGRQIKNGLQFLHDRDIVHGFPALQNVYINKTRKQVKLGKIGILSAIMQGSEGQRSEEGTSSTSTFLKAVKYPGLNEFLAGWFSQRRIIRMLHPEEKLEETWDRYVFGCTLWQLYNEGTTPLPDKSDQEILEKLEGKDCSWFNGGGYFKLPVCNTEFLNKLQKIICVCVTWGNKDNMEKYEFRKIAEAYEQLAEVVNNEQPTTFDYILKAGNGKLDFDVNVPPGVPNSKYTLVEEDDNVRVILVSNKKSNIARPAVEGGGGGGGGGGEQLMEVTDKLLERDKLLQLSDLEQLDGGRFVVPSPTEEAVEAVCNKFTLHKNVVVKCYSRCRDVPEKEFVEEVKHLLNFQHPNIVPLKGCIMLEDKLLLVTPSYKYKSLRDFLDNNNNTVTAVQRENYAAQICSGMKYLALNRCVHRNLRLVHVYLTNYSNVVITNFGLARVTESLYYQQKTVLSSDTFVIYPPEVISVLCAGGKVKFNSACDVWSYGVLLWELYSGEIAYNNIILDLHGNPDITLLDSYFRQGGVLEADRTWPERISTIITKCLNEEQRRITFFGIEDILTR